MLLDTDIILLVSMMKKAKLAAEWGKQDQTSLSLQYEGGNVPIRIQSRG